MNEIWMKKIWIRVIDEATQKKLELIFPFYFFDDLKKVKNNVKHHHQ
jgi:hypothetical protein